MEGYRILPGVGDDAGGWYLETPFDADYVEAIKAELPSRARGWRDHVGAWWIHGDFISIAETIAGRWFEPEPVGSAGNGRAAGVEPGGNGRGAEPAGRPAAADPWSVLWLRPGAPAAVVKASYRALARVNHPDAGGDPEVMAAINGAYEVLQGGE